MLKGKFTHNDIVEFVNNANSDIITFQLMTLILDKIQKSPYKITETAVTAAITSNTADPYGEYETYTSSAVVQSKSTDPISILCTAFGV